MIFEPGATTCKYLHRKDLPHFVVDEGIREHAAEFAGFPALVGLSDHRPINRSPYSERFAWDHATFDPVVQSLAQYWKIKPVWIFVQTFSGGMDGRRSLAHAALVRRYMDQCGTWSSSYRLVLALIQEIFIQPRLEKSSVLTEPGEDIVKACEDATWDVVFTRLSCIQEYGFHAGIEDLMWATDQLDGALGSLDLALLLVELKQKKEPWTRQIIQHAEGQGQFFPVSTSDVIHNAML